MGSQKSAEGIVGRSSTRLKARTFVARWLPEIRRVSEGAEDESEDSYHIRR